MHAQGTEAILSEGIKNEKKSFPKKIPHIEPILNAHLIDLLFVKMCIHYAILRWKIS